jgi:hypothetical protein
MKPLCCGFSKAWIGRCKQEVTGAHGMCFEHGKLKCVSCGAQATHDCEETGQFVCGAPLCNECEHTTAPDGTNGGIGFNAQKLPDGMLQHCKKTEQRFRPWYEREQTANVRGNRLAP